MRLADPDHLEHIGLTLYERKALMALMLCGVADAATLCREGSVPTSKIYLAMEKLAGLGLVQVQPTRPKMFAALPSEVVVARVIEIARERSEQFAAQASELQATFTGLQSRVRGRHPFVDLALGVEGHNRRHLVPLAAARKRILSYMEAGDLMAIDAAVKRRFPHPPAYRQECGGTSCRASGGVRLLLSERGSAGGVPQGASARLATGDGRQILRRAGASVSCGRRRDRGVAVGPSLHQGGPICVAARPGSRTRGQPGGRLSRTLAEGDEKSAGDPGGSPRPQDLNGRTRRHEFTLLATHSSKGRERKMHLQEMVMRMFDVQGVEIDALDPKTS